MEVMPVLMAIKADPKRAGEILERGIELDRRRVVADLAIWIPAALDGVIIDPDKL